LRRRWRDYTTSAGRRPVRDFILALSSNDAAEVAAAMAEVSLLGLRAARHLRGDLYEVRAWGERQSFRVLFAPEGRFGQVLLALDGFSKKTQKTPPERIELALERLRDWRARGTQQEGRSL
jgi:phage-related protein